ncbi:Dipeptidase [Cercospora zeina]
MNGTNEDDAQSDTYRIDAARLLETVPLIDGHNDFAYILRGWFRNDLNRSDFDINSMPIGQTDLRRLWKGKLGGQFWSAFVPCSPKEDGATYSILAQTLQQIDLLHELFRQYPKAFGFVHRSADILPTFRAGKLVSLLGIEGLHQIGGSMSALRMLYRLGVRYATLCHNSGNEFVDSATAPATHNGLSKKGLGAITEMNRLGMIIDLSHTSHEAQMHVMKHSKAPVIIRILHVLQCKWWPHYDMFRALAFGATTKGPNIERTSANFECSISCGSHHVGWAHVGIGSDFDGMLEGPSDLDDTAGFPTIIEELLRRGVDEEDIKSLMGLNILRVMEEVEGLGRAAQDIGDWDVLCDEIGSPWTPEQISLLLTRGSLRNGEV